MRIILSLAIVALIGSSVSAQSTDAGALPIRFDAFRKNDRLKLVRVYGSPELPASFASTSVFTPDGGFAVYYEELSTGDENKPILGGRLHVWDAAKKAWPREIELAGKSVHAISLSANGKIAALSGLTNIEKEDLPRSYLAIFDLAAGQFRHVTLTKTAPASVILLAADGESVIAGAFEDLQRWNVKTGKVTTTYKTANPAHVLALVPTTKPGQFLASYGGGAVRLWDAEGARVLRDFAVAKEPSQATHLAMALDGSHVGVGDFQGPVRVLDFTTGRLIAAFRPDKEDGERILTGLALSEDGKTVIVNWLKPNAALDDPTAANLIAFDVNKRRRGWSHLVPYRGRPAVRVAVREIQIGGGPNRYDEFDIPTGKHLSSWGAHRSPVNAIMVGPQGFIHSASTEPMVQVWGNGRLEDTVGGLATTVTALAASRDARSWLLAEANGAIRHTPPDNGRSIAIATGHKSTITSLAYNASAKWVYSASEDRTVKTWSTIDGGRIATLEGHAESVNAIAVSPDDRWLASGSSDATIRLWPIKDGKLDGDRDIIVLEGHTKAVACLAFSADGKSLITGSHDRSVKVWDWAKAKCVRSIVGHKNWITSLLVIDATRVLTTSDDLTACIWNLDTGKEIGQIDFGIIGDCPRCVTRTPNGNVFFGSSNWLIYEMELRLPQSKRGGGSSK